MQLREKGKKAFALLVDPDKADTFLKADLVFPSPLFLMFGGSLLTEDMGKESVKFLKKKYNLPVVLFPGNAGQVNTDADAIFFLSLVSGRNPDLLIGQHVIAAPMLKKSGMEVISTAYMLVESGSLTTAHYMSATLPLPAQKPEIAANTALAAQYIGMKIVYLDAGSGAEKPVPPALISAVRKAVEMPIIVGGGMKTIEDIRNALEAGADLVVLGTVFENGAEVKWQESLAALFSHSNYHVTR